MAEKRLFVTILLVASLELLNFQKQKLSSAAFKSLNIRKFVGMQEPIWTHSTTASFFVRCKVDVRKTITNTSISFRRTYYTDEERHWTAKNLEGIFLQKQKDVMQIRPPGEKFTAKETIAYIGPNYHCALIKVTPVAHGLTPYFDLRVLNSSVTHGVDPICLKTFAGFGERGRVIYGRRCQEILCIH